MVPHFKISKHCPEHGRVFAPSEKLPLQRTYKCWLKAMKLMLTSRVDWNTYVLLYKTMEDSIQTFHLYIFKQTLIRLNTLIQFYYKQVRQYLFCKFPCAAFKRC